MVCKNIAYISYRLGSMTISDGTETKSLTSYPPTRPSSYTDTPLWVDLEEEENAQSLLSIGRAFTYKNETEDDTICSFISEPMYVTKHAFQILDNTLSELEQEELTK